MNHAEKLSLFDMEELYAETAEGTYWPIKFRKMSYRKFVEIHRDEYLVSLGKEIVNLKERITNAGKVQEARPERRAPFVRKAR